MFGQRCIKATLLVLTGWVVITLIAVRYRMHTDIPPPVLFRWQALDEDGCKGFTDDPLDEAEVEFFIKLPTMSCSSKSAPALPSLLYVTEDGPFLKIDKEKIKSLRVKVDYCKYTPLRRAENDGDFKINILGWSESFTDNISIPVNVEHIWGHCHNGKTIVGTTYASIVKKNSTLEKILEENYKVHVGQNSPKETLSVLMFGIDGTSKLNFARQMPKTKSFILKEMRGIEMYKVNKVGQNTLPNVVPLLTGRSEEQIRYTWNDDLYLDVVDHFFLWEDARNIGYRTSVMFDRTKLTSFHFLKRGWKDPTFHYNNRPVVVNSQFDTLVRKPNKFCVGDVHEISFYYDYWLQLTKTFNNSKTTPYFGYSFFASVTHDNINMASSVDEIYLQVFQKFVQQNSFDNTLIIFFSDHGSRYGKFRNTFRGMLEDNNPFMLFIFPPWFEAKYPKVMANFRKNQNRVMTNYDVYATLKDILNFQGDDIANRKTNNQYRGISLFQKIPKRRTCEQAGIPIKFCNCRNFSSVGITQEIKDTISQYFLKQVVAKTELVRARCAVLSLNSTVSLMAMYTLSETHNYYQAAIKTSPGGAIYEATLKKGRTKKFKSVSIEGDITRTNLYRGQADCISKAIMRPFCYCRHLLSQ